jgi:ADP-ribosylglycohydrolase
LRPLAVSLGGDSDTLACITGGIAEAFYGPIPEEIARQMWSRLPKTFREILREMVRTWSIRWRGNGKSCSFAVGNIVVILLK